MKRLICVLILTYVFCVTMTAIAAVPVSVVRESRNGRQLIIKTYELAPEDDPAGLEEQPFEEGGYFYTLNDMIKEEIPLSEKRHETQTVTLDTDTDDLAAILKFLAPQLDYEQDGFTGKLTLDHTSITTTVSGYVNKTSTITDTKTIGNLDRNDPSYVPQTTVKNGVTLSLYDVSWSVQGTALAGNELVPATYMAIATYKGSVTRSVPSGYVTTALYTGDVEKSGVAKVVYTATYLGEEIPTTAPQTEPQTKPEPEPPTDQGNAYGVLFIIGAAAVLLALACALLSRYRGNVLVYAMEGEEYILCGRMSISPKRPEVDLRRLRRTPPGKAAVLIKRDMAARLFGRMITTISDTSTMRCLVDKRDGDFWYLFDESVKRQSLEQNIQNEEETQNED